MKLPLQVLLLYTVITSQQDIAHNNSFHEQKHIDIDCHMVCERLQQGLFHLLPIRTFGQLADLFTEALEKETFNKFISKVGVSSIHTPI